MAVRGSRGLSWQLWLLSTEVERLRTDERLRAVADRPVANHFALAGAVGDRWEKRHELVRLGHACWLKVLQRYEDLQAASGDGADRAAEHLAKLAAPIGEALAAALGDLEVDRPAASEALLEAAERLREATESLVSPDADP